MSAVVKKRRVAFLLGASILLATSFLCSTAAAAEIYLERSAPIAAASSLWKPSQLTHFGQDVFCFTAEDGDCESGVCPKTVLCTFDAGNSFVPSSQMGLPYCGDRGVVVDGQLYCPAEKLPSTEENVLRFSASVFSPQIGTGLMAAPAPGREFRFEVPEKGKIVYEDIVFVGSSLAPNPITSTFLLPVIVVDAANVKRPVMFSSEDGFSWAYLSKLPFKSPIDSMHALQLGQQKIGVVARTLSNTFERTTSNYMGRWWSDVKLLNATAPPFALHFPASSLSVQYGVTNATAGSAVYHAEEFPKGGHKRLVLSDTKNPRGSETSKVNAAATGSATSSHVVAVQPSADKIITISDRTSPDGRKHLQSVAFHVDDSEERALIDEREAEQAKKKAEEEAAREKARLAKQERQARERRERHRREVARRKAFEELDAPNIDVARRNSEVDGEFIVVRPSRKDTLDLEKEAFFW